MSNKKPTLHTEKSSLTCAVLERIEKDSVRPYSAWKFVCINYFVWIAWVFSVVFGAVSVAVLIYVGDHARFALYEATHKTTFSFLVEVMPYIWIVTFLCMSIFAYYNIRHTKSGYKYPFWKLLISSLLFSVGGGIVLHIFGIGYVIDTQLAKTMPVYRSLEHTEQRMWQSPQEGRLLGTFRQMDEKDEVYVFEDTSDNIWSIQTIELRDADRELLSSGKTVRVLGTTTDSTLRQFHACGVFPWMYDKKVSIDDMKKDRKLFLRRMYDHMETGERLKRFEHAVFDNDQDMPFEEEGLCAEISAVKRMKF
jgi:hypothetical protein